MSNVHTPEFRVSYPHVFKAKKNDLNGKDEYSLVALFSSKTDLAKLKAAAQAVIESKWGSDKKKWPPNLKTPFRKQEERAKQDDNGNLIFPEGYEKGGIFLTLKSEARPGLVDKNVQPIIDPSDFYAGCYAIASIRAYAYDQKGNKGVAFGLQNIQKTKEGDPISGRVKAEAEFAPIETAEGDSDIFG